MILESSSEAPSWRLKLEKEQGELHSGQGNQSRNGHSFRDTTCALPRINCKAVWEKKHLITSTIRLMVFIEHILWSHSSSKRRGKSPAVK